MVVPLLHQCLQMLMLVSLLTYIRNLLYNTHTHGILCEFSCQLFFLGEDTMTIMEEDLRLCSVKPVIEGDRRFCFEVLSPAK